MLSFTIHDTKNFMALLLKGDLFDTFIFRQGEIHTYATFLVDGTKPELYQSEENPEPFCQWSEIKPFFFQGIKGKAMPRSMKIVFSLSSEKTAHYPNAQAVFLNLLFRDGVLLVTTATSDKTFTLDRNTGQQWDADILKFFKKHEIAIQMES
ncbi:DUF5721 family protein [Chakrabartyella piscis]|uniref:DUF5721 family protein n=1 Tax=Chakrabartyella piscis TaxID=2918914 RepID=UPI0029587BA1|nr:DUF5721 family protein [Chakrabartyella piscis]